MKLRNMLKIKTLSIIFLLTAMSVSAQTWQIGSPNAADVTATLDNGTLTISGIGAMQDFDSMGQPWSSITTTVVIENGVTNIGNYAFYSCNSLTSVTIPNSVTDIGSYAFSYCYSLTSVTIPNGVTNIGIEAFSYCYSLTSVTIPNSVTDIGSYAFSFCNSLTSIEVDSANSSYASENGVLFNKDKTTLICFPAGKSGAYTIPNGVTNIGIEAFSFCNSLTSVTIPNGVTNIGIEAFSFCNSLTSIEVDSANSSYASENGVLFNKDKTTLICFPAGKSGAYTIPNSVTNIGNYAFSACNSLTSVTIPNGVTNIGIGAFSYCYSLTSVTIPNSVTNIEDFAFNPCINLTDVTVNWETPLSIVASVFESQSVLSKTLHVPAGTQSAYATAPVWQDFNIIGDVPNYTITASASSGGNISPSGAVFVSQGSDQSFTFSPNTNYLIDQVLVDDVNNTSAVSTGSYTFTNVTANHTISVTFKPIQYTITASAGTGGNISQSGVITVNQGDSKTFTFSPNTNYLIDQVLVDDVNNTSAVSTGSYTFTNVTVNHTISVTFKPIQYTITASAGTGGNISQSGVITVNQGDSKTFTFSPNTNYLIDQVLIDDVNNTSAVSTGSYTFTNVTANHTISVSFKPDCLSNIVVQVWDDVLSVVNNPANNGGNTFVSYQWLKNGVAITGETSGNLYLANIADKTVSDYTCRVKTSDGQTLESCPFQPSTRSAISAYPNPTYGSVIIESPTIEEGDKIGVYSSEGTLVKQYLATPLQTKIDIGNQPKGIYIIKVNGKQMKIILL